MATLTSDSGKIPARTGARSLLDQRIHVNLAIDAKILAHLTAAGIQRDQAPVASANVDPVRTDDIA